MGHFGELVKKKETNSILYSLVLGIIGLIIIFKPSGTLKFVTNIIGITLLISGTYKIISFCIYKNKYNLYNYEIFGGVVTLIIGIIIIAIGSELETIFRVLIGVTIIYKSFSNIVLALELKQMETKLWVVSLLIGILMFIIGLYIIFTPSVLIITVGIILVVNSIIDIFDSIILIKDIKRMEKIFSE